jgi:rhodanese-related sulfurtransferase
VFCEKIEELMNIRKTSIQTLVILLISIILGFANQIVNPNRVKISFQRPQAPVSDDSTFESVERPNVDGPIVLSKTQLLKLIQNKNVVIIDSRTPDEYSFSHIPMAINIPFEQLGEHIDQVDALPKDKWLVPYCDGPPCEKSMEMATIFFEMGFERVAYYYAGLDDWTTTEEVEQ